MDGNVGVEELRGRVVRLELKLRARGTEWNGAITSFGDAAPGKTMAGAVTHWVWRRRPGL